MATARQERQLRRIRRRLTTIDKRIKRMFAYQTPRPGNKCKSKGCKGTVVQKATGMFRGRIHYGIPECKVCGRTYLQAKGTAKVGAKEFIDSLHQPMTI